MNKSSEQNEIRLLDVVALMEDLPSDGLVRGQIGTVVEELAKGVFEVEFSDKQGRAYALLPLRREQLLRLHDNPAKVA